MTTKAHQMLLNCCIFEKILETIKVKEGSSLALEALISGHYLLECVFDH
jgi:hypothetical protein